ncbi:uncharacterized protein LOC131203157 [Ahaetulla prasina]|uniref:uncharacterized protein LOC131203157 n=1 Tax=Ahaetulla prasina TaxID=499056 RepID=UPI00264788E7|nr:uncharacterized protein LOC131203157 [Ahaetulla prasina]
MLDHDKEYLNQYNLNYVFVSEATERRESGGSATMKSLEIICCLFIVIFALAVAHPLPDNVLEQAEAKEDPTAPALKPMDPSRPEPALLFNNPTAPALELIDPSRPEPALLFNNPTAPALEPMDPSRPEPALHFNNPTAPALELKDPSRPEPALLLKDPTAPADLQKLPADGTAPSSDMSQDDLQEQKDSEAIMFSEEALEAILNEEAEERELQKEE